MLFLTMYKIIVLKSPFEKQKLYNPTKDPSIIGGFLQQPLFSCFIVKKCTMTDRIRVKIPYSDF